MQIIIIQWAFPLFPNSRHFKTNHHFPRGLPLITLAVDIFSRVFISRGFLFTPLEGGALKQIIILSRGFPLINLTAGIFNQVSIMQRGFPFIPLAGGDLKQITISQEVFPLFS